MLSDPAQRFFEAERRRAAGDRAGAEAAYRALLDEMPRHVGGLQGLAALHDAAGRVDDAAACRSRIDAVRAEGAANVGAMLLYHNDLARARRSLEQALALDENCLKAHWLMGDVCARDDDRTGALVHYRRCREIAPERLGPGFMMAALGDGETPACAPADFVTAQFDWYADRFDEHLLGTLLYRGPEEVARVLRDGFAGTAPSILDLGCGTGLLGAEVAPFAGRLVGVDLSPKMLEKAAARGHYDALHAADIVAFVAGWQAGTADIVAAVDVVVYFGDLGPLFAGAAGAVRRGGMFVFTTERWDDDEPGEPPAGRAWRLRPTGRYQHTRAGLRALAADHGFEVERIEDRVLRYELGLPVDSDLVVLRSPT